ncbi:MAG: hypothetical protein RR291_04585, partial [Clostridia bacterium]
GLKEVGFSDHGLRHIARGMSKKEIVDTRDEIERLRGKYKVRPMLSIESNIYSSDGKIDLTEEERHMFDYVIAGYHKAVWPSNFIDTFRFTIPAIFANFRHYTDGQRRRYTRALVNAITSNKVNIISHLCHGIPVFIKEVAKAAVDYNVFIELNGKKVSMTDDEILTLQDYGVNFILDSDAHTPDRVGEISVPLEVVDRLNLNKDKIVNWEKLPNLYLR